MAEKGEAAMATSLPHLRNDSTPQHTQEWLKTVGGIVGHMPGMTTIFQKLRDPTAKEIQALVYAMYSSQTENEDEGLDSKESADLADAEVASQSDTKSKKSESVNAESEIDVPEDILKEIRKYKSSKQYKAKLAEKL
jgi:hypothetical protein